MGTVQKMTCCYGMTQGEINLDTKYRYPLADVSLAYEDQHQLHKHLWDMVDLIAFDKGGGLLHHNKFSEIYAVYLSSKFVKDYVSTRLGSDKVIQAYIDELCYLATVEGTTHKLKAGWEKDNEYVNHDHICRIVYKIIDIVFPKEQTNA